jgi:hypothetical protein
MGSGITAITKGTGSPSRVTSPNLIRGANVVPYGQQLAKDLEFLSQNINSLFSVLSRTVPNFAAVYAAVLTGTPPPVTPSAWQNWTPTVTPLAPMTVSGGATIGHAYYLAQSPILFFSFEVFCTFAGTASGQVDFSLPVNASDSFYHACAGSELGAGYVTINSHVVGNVCRFSLPDSTTFVLNAGHYFRASGFYSIPAPSKKRI